MCSLLPKHTVIMSLLCGIMLVKVFQVSAVGMQWKSSSNMNMYKRKKIMLLASPAKTGMNILCQYLTMRNISDIIHYIYIYIGMEDECNKFVIKRKRHLNLKHANLSENTSSKNFIYFQNSTSTSTRNTLGHSTGEWAMEAE